MDRAEKRAIEWDCIGVSTSFFHYLDERDYEALAALMAPDGTWPRQGRTLTGPAEVLDALRGRPASMITRHMVTNFLVTIHDPDRATVRFNLTVYLNEAAGTAPPPRIDTVRACTDELVRVNGEWKLQSKTSIAIFQGA
jgi:hypothetical protein